MHSLILAIEKKFVILSRVVESVGLMERVEFMEVSEVVELVYLVVNWWTWYSYESLCKTIFMLQL